MVAVPADTPVTVAVVPAPTILATPEALLLHVPPGVTSVYVPVVPLHTSNGPLIAAGEVFTVTVAVRWQPPVNA